MCAVRTAHFGIPRIAIITRKITETLVLTLGQTRVMIIFIAVMALERIEIKLKNKKDKIKISKRKILLIALWTLFGVAFLFAVYKNFTAINTHTIHEKVVVEERLSDTSKLESFTAAFAAEYYQWGNSAAALKAREDNLTNYLTEELCSLNHNLISGETRSSASMVNFKIWGIEKLKDSDYKVTYSLTQKTINTTVETVTEYVDEVKKQKVKNEKTGKDTVSDVVVQKEVTKDVEKVTKGSSNEIYYIVVHVDDSGDMVITQNPTLTSLPKKSSFVPEKPSLSLTVDTAETKEITDFLSKFFALYPTADPDTLSYYVKTDGFPLIERKLVFQELTNKSFYKNGKGYIALVDVKFKNEATGAYNISQYRLRLQKDTNWFIIGEETGLALSDSEEHSRPSTPEQKPTPGKSAASSPAPSPKPSAESSSLK